MKEPLNAFGKPLRFFTEDNTLVTREMFDELRTPDDESWAQFTLKSWDTEYPSLHRLYVEMQDLSEYEFATTYFYNYTHWQLVKAMPKFQQFYHIMRSEVEARLSSKAQRAMVDQVTCGTASQATLKYLADRDYKAKSNTPTSKPSAELHVIHNDDLSRIKS